MSPESLLEAINVSFEAFRGLANAFSRVACGHEAFLQRLAQRLRRDAAAALLPPVAAAMALNAFAVLRQAEEGLVEALVDSVRPCVADFTVTQAALVADALQRLEATAGGEVLRAFVRHWLAVDLLSLAQPEDVAHLASAAVKLQLLEDRKRH